MRFRKINIFAIFFLAVAFASAAPSVSVTPQTQTVKYGSKATVRVTTTQAVKCTVTGGQYNKNNTQINGNVLLTPQQTTSYTFECVDSSGGTNSATTNITVTGAPATQPNNPTQPTTQNPTGQGNGQRPAVQYPQGTVLTEANNICQQYSGFQSVYGVPTAGGGSSVPVDLTSLAPYLENISRETQLTANELRAADMIRFCRIMPNIAQAAVNLAQNAAKDLKMIGDTCIADRRCYVNRVANSELQQKIDLATSFPLYGREIAKLLSQRPENNPPEHDDIELINYCNDELNKGHTPIECVNYDVQAEKYITDKYYNLRDDLDSKINKLNNQFFQNGGIIGQRPCTKTVDGSDPTNVPWYDKNCLEFIEQPVEVTKSVLNQISSLPYTQAFSPAAEFGVDQNINNLNTRFQNGNLIDPNISTSFGSTGGGGGTNPTVNPYAQNLKDAGPNLQKILTNIKVITTLYDVTRAAYASSSATSVCKNMPVASRKSTISKIDTAKKTYTDYASAITKAWNEALKTPNENHMTLVTQINFDLKDKYSQDNINQVYDATKKLLQACVDAQGNGGSSPSL